MRKILIIMSFAAVLAAVTACKDNPFCREKKDADCCARQEKGMVTDAIRDKSNDFEQIEMIGNTVVYTHIFDGIIDEKTYTYDGDVCVGAERVYIFPDQLSALRHYRRAIEQAELYDDIKLLKNEVRYDLKEAQHKLETDGLTKEQLKARFDKQLSEAKKDLK